MDAVMEVGGAYVRTGFRCGLVLLLCICAACGRKAKEQAVAEPEWIARVNGELITEADVQFEIQRRIQTRRPIGEVDALVQDLVQRKVMLNEARRSGILDDPEVRRELENRELGQWRDRTLQVARDAVRVTDDELRAHYEANLVNHTTPALARLAVLYRKVHARDAEETSETLAAELNAARERYLADPAAATQSGRVPGFGVIAADSSEDTVSRYRGGDIGWIREGEEHRLPDEVIQAGWALDVGAVSEVLRVGDGLYVVMKSDVRPPAVTPFDQVAPGLRRHLIRERQEEIERSFISNLLAAASVEIDPSRIARIALPKPEAVEPPVLRPTAERHPEAPPPSPLVNP